MKAIVQDTYGTPDVLRLDEVDEPVVGDDRVLVRVHAAGLDPGVWHVMSGLPYLIRIMGYGLRRPRSRVRGNDLAGRVEAVGTSVTPGGTLVIVGAEGGGRWLGGMERVFAALLLSPFVGQRLRFQMPAERPGDLAALAELVTAGKLTPLIDRSYPMSEVPEAVRKLAEGHARGKIVITVRGQ